jgi:hypothetical protein
MRSTEVIMPLIKKRKAHQCMLLLQSTPLPQLDSAHFVTAGSSSTIWEPKDLLLTGPCGNFQVVVLVLCYYRLIPSE